MLILISILIHLVLPYYIGFGRYEIQKRPEVHQFVPELVHNRSGAGSDVLAVDLNKDGAIDIISSTNRGTFIFWNKQAKKRQKK